MYSETRGGRKEGCVALSRWTGKGKNGSRKKSDYIITLPFDGRKAVDFDKLYKDPRVKEQVKRLREQIIEPQRKQAQEH